LIACNLRRRSFEHLNREMTEMSTPARTVPAFTPPKSHEAFARACWVIPGGVNSPARAFGVDAPPFMARAEG
jgi:glutamate-1-semialdehyde 2,1-aminomutase